ncbi:MAG: hypothetical protein HYX78_13370 [Armatimonadetes bacterium]|nr:hypothetical protein [Armatimonadota bacterium]
MQKSVTLLIVSAIAALLAVTAAQAQFDYYDVYDQPSRWNIHAGIGFLSGDIDEDTTWVVGVEHERPLGGEVDRTDSFLTLGVDWMPIDTNTTGTESVVPILIGYRRYTALGARRVYFGIAAGTRWASEDIPELDIKDGFEFEWGLNTGINFTPEFFGQLRYLAGSEPSDDGVFTIELGYRF